MTTRQYAGTGRLGQIRSEIEAEKKAYAKAIEGEIKGEEIEKAYVHFNRAVFLQSFLYAYNDLPYQPVIKPDGSIWVGWIMDGEFIADYLETGQVFCQDKLLHIDEHNKVKEVKSV